MWKIETRGQLAIACVVVSLMTIIGQFLRIWQETRLGKFVCVLGFVGIPWGVYWRKKLA